MGTSSVMGSLSCDLSGSGLLCPRCDVGSDDRFRKGVPLVFFASYTSVSLVMLWIPASLCRTPRGGAWMFPVCLATSGLYNSLPMDMSNPHPWGVQPRLLPGIVPSSTGSRTRRCVPGHAAMHRIAWRINSQGRTAYRPARDKRVHTGRLQSSHDTVLLYRVALHLADKSPLSV